MTITRTARGNCDHLPCQIPVSLQGECELIESTEATPNGWVGAGITRTVVDAHYRGRYVGSIRDDGYFKHKSLGGEWVECWSAFAGGNAIHVPPSATRNDALAILLEHVAWASFHLRMALHG